MCPEKPDTLKKLHTWQGWIAKLSSGSFTLFEWVKVLYRYGRNCCGVPLVGLAVLEGSPDRKGGNEPRSTQSMLAAAGNNDIISNVLSGNGKSAMWHTEVTPLDTTRRSLAIFQKKQDLEREQIQSFLTLMRSYYLRYRIYKRSVDCWGPEQAIILIGTHPHFLTAVDYTQICARSNHPVLITGETGTGKELFARALHVLKPHSDGPFIPVNCAYLDPQMAHSHLFGHCKGSFTGAHESRNGVFRQAEGGTLFLDEIEALSPDVQAMLLRAMDNGEINPLGADFPTYIKTRLVAATNRDPAYLMDTGQLRRDLYFRMQSHLIDLPQLQDRGSADIRDLAWYFLHLENAQQGINKSFTVETIRQLARYHWPGNVRELHNVVLSAFYESRDLSEIRPNHIPTKILDLDEVLDNGKVSIATRLFHSITEEEKNFWEVVHRPYLRGDLNRSQVRELCERGFEAVGARDLKLVSKLFRIPQKQWRRFYLFVRRTIFK